MKKLYLFKSYVCLIPFFLSVSFFAISQTTVIKIDLGDENRTSPSPWNNFTTSYSLSQIDDCLDTLGNYTGITAAITDAFGGVNRDGFEADSSLGIIDEASGDSFYGQNGNTTAAICFSNLKPSRTYSFGFYASRKASDNREAEYIVQGIGADTAYLDAASNSKNMAYVNNVTPQSDGTININVAAGPNNSNSAGYFYLGAIVLTYSDITTSVSSLEQNTSKLKAYPNPVTDDLMHVEYCSEANTKAMVEIYSLAGKKVSVFEKDIVSGENQIDISTRELPNGLYVLKISENNNAPYVKFEVIDK